MSAAANASGCKAGHTGTAETWYRSRPQATHEPEMLDHASTPLRTADRRRSAFELPRLSLPPVPDLQRRTIQAAPAQLAQQPLVAPVVVQPHVQPALAPAPQAPVAAVIPTIAAQLQQAVVTPLRIPQRRDGVLVYTIAVVAIVVVCAAAHAMQRSMHGWPPGSHC